MKKLVILCMVCSFLKNGIVTAQNFVSPIILSQYPVQTIGSNITASVIANSSVGHTFNVIWEINGTRVGASYNNGTAVIEETGPTKYSGRFSVVGFFPNSSNSKIISSTFIFGPLRPEDSVTLRALNVQVVKTTINVTGCPTSVGGCRVKTCSCSPCSSYGCIATFACPGCEVMATCKENVTWSATLPCSGATPCPTWCIGISVVAALCVTIVVVILVVIARKGHITGKTAF